MYGNDKIWTEFSFAKIGLNTELNKKQDSAGPAVTGCRVNLTLSLVQRELSLCLLRQIRDKSPADVVRGCRIWMVAFPRPNFKHKLHGLIERWTAFVMSADKT
jgi:hypothetical protein